MDSIASRNSGNQFITELGKTYLSYVKDSNSFPNIVAEVKIIKESCLKNYECSSKIPMSKSPTQYKNKNGTERHDLSVCD